MKKSTKRSVVSSREAFAPTNVQKMIQGLRTNLKIASIEFEDWQDRLAKGPLTALESADDAIQSQANIRAITIVLEELENTMSITKALNLAEESAVAGARYATVSGSQTRNLVSNCLTAAYAQIAHNFRNYRPGAKKS